MIRRDAWPLCKTNSSIPGVRGGGSRGRGLNEIPDVEVDIIEGRMSPWGPACTVAEVADVAGEVENVWLQLPSDS